MDKGCSYTDKAHNYSGASKEDKVIIYKGNMPCTQIRMSTVYFQWVCVFFRSQMHHLASHQKDGLPVYQALGKQYIPTTNTHRWKQIVHDSLTINKGNVYAEWVSQLGETNSIYF